MEGFVNFLLDLKNESFAFKRKFFMFFYKHFAARLTSILMNWLDQIMSK
jgi:hypothetical protein